MAEFANGRINAGLTTGIIGTTLGVLNGGLGNLLGGWNNGCGCSENTAVNRYELGQEQTISRLQSEVALRDANIFTDQKIATTYASLNSDIKDLTSKVNEIDKTLAVKNAQIEGTFAVLGERINAQRNEFMCALNREKDERCCGDNSIVTYANATFTPKSIIGNTVDATNVTTQATYNPVYNCGCCR